MARRGGKMCRLIYANIIYIAQRLYVRGLFISLFTRNTFTGIKRRKLVVYRKNNCTRKESYGDDNGNVL